MQLARCRSCQAELRDVFADLGVSPLSNSFIRPARFNDMEPFYPLCAYVCRNCFLVQLIAARSGEAIFSEYVYFSSYSDSWLAHVRAYVDAMIPRLRLSSKSFVLEIASNDGYLLQFFRQREIPVLGIEPAANVAKVALEKGIPTRSVFFGSSSAAMLAREVGQADLLIGNNVLAHVPDLHDFVAGVKVALAPKGTATFEFPHLLRLMKGAQYDTIYHEHFSYFSLLSVSRVFAAHGLEIYDLDELETHGGSLRVYLKHKDSGLPDISPAVRELEGRERDEGLGDLATYASFSQLVVRNKREVLRFFLQCADRGESVAGYGAPAKGNTLLNYCGITPDMLPYTVDRNPDKQGTYLPGVRIPVYAPEKIAETKPHYVLILPWNIADEIVEQLSFVREWGGQFVTPIPVPRIVP